MPVANLHLVPAAIASEAAALTEPLACVCHALLDPPIVTDNDSVLVVGPGPIGLIAAQVARASGGDVHVRGTARDALRLAKARELGLTTSLVGDELGVFDVVIECSGREHGMTACFQHACRGGRYVQVGLAGRTVSVPFDEICFRELTVTGGNASTTQSWQRALELIDADAVDLGILVTEVVPLAEWERAFEATRSAKGVKFVLDPR